MDMDHCGQQLLRISQVPPGLHANGNASGRDHVHNFHHAHAFLPVDKQGPYRAFAGADRWPIPLLPAPLRFRAMENEPMRTGRLLPPLSLPHGFVAELF